MTKRLLGITLAMVVLCTIPSLAGSLSGATGLFNVPTADVSTQGVVGAMVHVANKHVAASLNYGLFDFLEIGASTRTHGSHGTQFSAFAKAQIFPETVHDPGLAVGIDDGAAYLVMSKAMAPLLRGHVGIGTGRFGLFGGVSYLVNPVVVTRPPNIQMPRVLLIAEYDGSKANLGTRLSFAQGLDINVALVGARDVTIGAAWRTRF